MELELKRDAIHCFETVADVTICQEETQEAIVPDACPDILRIVEVCGQACLTGKQAREGMATVSGMVRASVLYLPETGGCLRHMELSVPFTCQVEAPGLTSQGTILADPRLRWAEARVLNPRKILLRVDLALLLAAAIALVDALPIFGTGTVLIPWAVLELLAGNLRLALGLLALYLVVWLVRSLLEPRLLGARAGLPPLPALMAMYVGFRAFGVAGMVLAPLVLLLLKELHDAGFLRLWRD